MIAKLEVIPFSDWRRTGRHEEFWVKSIKQQINYFAAREHASYANQGVDKVTVQPAQPVEGGAYWIQAPELTAFLEKWMKDSSEESQTDFSLKENIK